MSVGRALARQKVSNTEDLHLNRVSTDPQEQPCRPDHSFASMQP